MFDPGFVRFAKQRAEFLLRNLYGVYQVTRRAPGVEIRHDVTIIHPELLECGPDLRVEAGCFIHCGGNAWSGGRGSVRFGRGCTLSQNNVLYGAGGIEFGDHVVTGPGVSIYSSREDYSLKHAYDERITHQFAKVTIESYARVFSGVTIGPGVTVGEGSVIGAGSVVLKDVPAWTVVAGAPARVLGPRGEDRPLSARRGETPGRPKDGG